MEPDNGGSWTVLPGGPSIEAGKHLDPRRALERQVLRLHALLLFLVDDPQIKGRLMVVHEEVEIPAKDAIVHRTGHPLVLRLLAESHDAAEHQPQHARFHLSLSCNHCTMAARCSSVGSWWPVSAQRLNLGALARRSSGSTSFSLTMSVSRLPLIVSNGRGLMWPM